MVGPVIAKNAASRSADKDKTGAFDGYMKVGRDVQAGTLGRWHGL
jgi:hypothetical protein